MVQVEMTMVCLDEGTRRNYERYAPSVRKRLRVIRQLADAGIFVRIMAMPLMCTREEALELRRIAVEENGARGFKHKDLNYFEEADVRRGAVERRRRRNDNIDVELLVESGESVDGEFREVLMPVSEGKKRWVRFEPRAMPVLRSGYVQLNNINWGYLI